MASLINQTVIHPKHGPGVIKHTKYGGMNLAVQFKGQNGLFFVRMDEVEFAIACSDPIAVSHEHRQQLEKLKPRRMLEAFRLGIVPEDCITAFTFGREHETSEFKNWLHQPDEGGLVLIGSYGSGKTHFLKYASRCALEEGYAIAATEINPLESPFSKPKRIYRQLVQNLRVPTISGEVLSFRALLEKAFQHNLLLGHPYFQYVAKYRNNADIWRWIEATEDDAKPYSIDNAYKDLPGLYGHHGNTANIFCYLLSTLGWLVRQKEIGAKGLLLMFDEAESLDQSYTSTAIDRSYNFLNALIATANSEPTLLNKPTTSSRFDYAAHADTVPFLYERNSGLKTLLTFTSHEYGQYSDDLMKLPKLYLEPLSPQVLNRVFEQICTLYAEVFDITEQQSKFDQLREIVIDEYEPTRLAVKKYIEALDLVRFYPHKELSEILR